MIASTRADQALRTNVAVPSIVSTIGTSMRSVHLAPGAIACRKHGLRSLIGIFSVSEYPRRETVLTRRCSPRSGRGVERDAAAGPWILFPTGLSSSYEMRMFELDGRARWSSNPRSVTVKSPEALFASDSEAGSAGGATHLNPAALSTVAAMPCAARSWPAQPCPSVRAQRRSARKSSSESRPCGRRRR